MIIINGTLGRGRGHVDGEHLVLKQEKRRGVYKGK